MDPAFEARVEARLAEILHNEKDDIALSLGLPTQDVREWTDEEAQLIIAECDRQWRDGVIEHLMSEAAPSR
jgi:hypothetical protein